MTLNKKYQSFLLLSAVGNCSLTCIRGIYCENGTGQRRDTLLVIGQNDGRRSCTATSPLSLIKRPSDEVGRLAKSLTRWRCDRSRELWEVSAEAVCCFLLRLFSVRCLHVRVGSKKRLGGLRATRAPGPFVMSSDAVAKALMERWEKQEVN